MAKVTTITLNDICSALKLDAKAARSKLRRAEKAPKKVDGRWVFKKTDEAAVKKIIKG